jgi:hypothetical protein
MRPAFLLLLAALALPGAAAAQVPREDGVQPLDRLLPEIRRTHPGKFYDADGPTDGHYHLKWMTPDGRVEWLDTDGRTGRVTGGAPGRDAGERGNFTGGGFDRGAPGGGQRGGRRWNR